MEYFYKMHFNDGTSKNVTNSELKGQPLDVFDRYALDGKLNALSKATIEREGLPIVSTGVLCKPGNGHNPYEYPIIADDNFYFDDELFNSVYDATLYSYGKPYRERVIKSDCEQLTSMTEYLFDELENDSDNFFNNIYNCNNSFKDDLYRYVQVYKNNMSKEDNDQLEEIKATIKSRLSSYRTYRTVATKRYLYEKKYIDIQTEEFPDVKNMSEEQYYTYLTQKYNRENNAKVEKDSEEFIEPNEYDMMTGYDPDAVVLTEEGRNR